MLLSFRYGAASYVLFVGTFVYGIGLIGNAVVPKLAAGQPSVCVWNQAPAMQPVLAAGQQDRRCEDEEVVKIPRCEL